jgi:hypothetical protein
MDKNIKTELQKLRDRESKSYQLYLANLHKAKLYFEKYKDYAFKVQRVQEQVIS